PHNGTDQILQKLTPAQQKLVTISIETEEAEDGKIVAKANWTISLAKFSMTRPESMSEMTTPEIN
ncbi:MAG: hypothetical protein NTV34_06795, partial [Proteobacteria bacterium]|nr:hypothetical protein [Pseudomonadota bacterium]